MRIRRATPDVKMIRQLGICLLVKCEWSCSKVVLSLLLMLGREYDPGYPQYAWSKEVLSLQLRLGEE